MTQRQIQAQETKHLIQVSFTELLKDKDFEKIGIRDITAKAGVSPGTFYLYFKNKEEALLYIYRAADEAFLNLDMTEDPWENLKRIFTLYFRMVDAPSRNTTKSIYISHLKYFNSYFLDENRNLFIFLEREMKKLIIDKENSRKASWRVLEFCRGRVYNHLIGKETVIKTWREEQLTLTLDYIHYIASQESII